MTIRELYNESSGAIFDNFHHPFLSVKYHPIVEEYEDPETGDILERVIHDDDPLFLECRGLYDEMLYPNILLNCGYFQSIYSGVEEMAEAVRIWSGSRAGVWNDLVRTTIQKYNLVHNTDRTEEHEDVNSVEETGRSSGNNTSENSVSAFDSAEYAPRDKTVGSGDGESERKVEARYTHKVRAYGNIGVTTSQQMLEEERKLVQFNIIDYIVADFKKNFCIAVY